MTALDNREKWAMRQFKRLRRCVAFIETTAPDGSLGIGACFHVGDGVFVTAAHVVRDRTISAIGFDDYETASELRRAHEDGRTPTHGDVSITSGPHFHSSLDADVACFRAKPAPDDWIPLGGHLDDWMEQYALVMHRTLIAGYPPIPFADRPVLVASSGEISALIDKYSGGRHPYFVISTMARGGFSGGPALVAYNEDDEAGTSVLGVVTEALVADGRVPELGFMTVLTVEPIYDCLAQHQMLPKRQGFEALFRKSSG